jgi:hypothetical protein
MFHQQSVAEHTDGDMGNFEVYLSDFQPGTVCLGGSGATTGSSSNYIVAVGDAGDGPPPPPPPPATDSRGHDSDFECVSCIISCRSGIDADPTLPSGVYSVCALNGSPAYDVFCRARALPLKQSSPWCCLGDHL